VTGVFNAQLSVQTVPLFDQHQCYVVDDALAEPERWVQLAAQHRCEFVMTSSNAYPGPELALPEPIADALDECFARMVRARLGARRTLRCYARLAMVTLRPENLLPRQWICHRDRFNVPPEQSVAASVLYLFRDPALGGTNFYRARRQDGLEQMVHDSGVLAANEFGARYGIERGYMTESNAWFEKMCTIAPRFNRLIFYDGSLFHCGDITAPELMQGDPSEGRLTLNGFFTCRRSVQF